MNRRGFFASLLAPVLAPLLPQSEIGLPAGEVVYHFSQAGMFEFGWNGFKRVDEAFGETLWASNVIVPNPRTGFRLRGGEF